VAKSNGGNAVKRSQRGEKKKKGKKSRAGQQGEGKTTAYWDTTGTARGNCGPNPDVGSGREKTKTWGGCTLEKRTWARHPRNPQKKTNPT